jgi:hypothetical protein
MLTVDAWRQLTDLTYPWQWRYDEIAKQVRATLMALDEHDWMDSKDLANQLIPADAPSGVVQMFYQALRNMARKNKTMDDCSFTRTRFSYGRPKVYLYWRRPTTPVDANPPAPIPPALERSTLDFIAVQEVVRQFLGEEAKFGSTVSEEISSMLGDILSHEEKE